MPKAAIYARISSDPTGAKLGTARQLEDCRTLAERKGWPVVAEFVDDDTSAYSGRARPQYRELLTAIESKAVTAVIVWHVDRLHRQPKELEEFFEVCDQAGLKDLASVTGDLDLSTHDGRFTARILGAVARKESDDKSRRISRKALEKAVKGEVAGGGTRPFGFESDKVTVRPAEAAVIRELVDRFLAGETLNGLCADLDNRGVRTPTGGPWKSHPLRRMLRSARISGQREHRGEIVADATWPAIIPPEQTVQVRAVLSNPARRTSRTGRRYLLAGFLRCGKCGATMVSRPRADGTRRYVCAKGPNTAGCGRLTIVADPLEELVVEALLFRLDSPDLARAMAASASNGHAGDLQRDIEAGEAQLAELAGVYAERKITVGEWMAAREPIEARLGSTRAELGRLTGATALSGFLGADDLAPRWSGLPLSRQQAILRQVLDHAIIEPGTRGLNRFQPERVRPFWIV